MEHEGTKPISEGALRQDTEKRRCQTRGTYKESVGGDRQKTKGLAGVQ